MLLAQFLSWIVEVYSVGVVGAVVLLVYHVAAVVFHLSVLFVFMSVRISNIDFVSRLVVTQSAIICHGSRVQWKTGRSYLLCKVVVLIQDHCRGVIRVVSPRSLDISRISRNALSYHRLASFSLKSVNLLALRSHLIWASRNNGVVTLDLSLICKFIHMWRLVGQISEVVRSVSVVSRFLLLLKALLISKVII
jgi:hypothetical protein